MNAGRVDADSFLRAWRNMTGQAIDGLDRNRTIVVVSASPLEVHGPHLPVTTDITESEGLLRATLRRLHEQRPELTFVHLPPVWMAADVLPSVGSIRFRPRTLQRVLEDLGRSLNAQGFRNIWVCNFHGGPRHFVAIEHACHRVNRRHGARMLSIFSLLLSRLGKDGSHELDHVLGEVEGVDPGALVGDTHGGYLETSMMLHLLGEHVEDPSGLEPVTMEAWKARHGGAKGPLAPFLDSYRFFASTTYAGAPAGASAELGARFVDVLAGHTAQALEELLDGQIGLDAARSPLWKLRRILLNPVLGGAFERMAGVRSPVW